jgi:hypothetical protein
LNDELVERRGLKDRGSGGCSLPALSLAAGTGGTLGGSSRVGSDGVDEGADGGYGVLLGTDGMVEELLECGYGELGERCIWVGESLWMRSDEFGQLVSLAELWQGC